MEQAIICYRFTDDLHNKWNKLLFVIAFMGAVLTMSISNRIIL